MTQPLTDVQADRQNDTVETQWRGATATQLQPNTSADASHWINMDIPKLQTDDAFTPPSTSEIHHQMWVGSFMMTLMAGLASGNAAGGIVGGLWAAIGIHDYGNTLQQRAKSVPQLRKEGYSDRAILKWYEDGDGAELDKERDFMERKREHADTLKHESDVMQQQKTFHDDEMENARLSRQQSQRNADRAFNLQQQSANLQALKYAADMGATLAGGAQVGDGVHVQNAALVKGGQPPSMPPEIAAMPPELQAAAMNAYVKKIQIDGLKDIGTQLSNAKNLRLGLSSQNQLFGKVEDYYKKGITAPHTQSGDFQANQSALGIESPSVGPKPTQVEDTESHMSDGIFGGAWDSLLRHTGYGQSGAARENTNGILTNSFIQQASGLANEAKNAVQSGGYDLSNPKVLAGVVSGLGGHISGDDLKKLMSGDMTPEEWAQQEADKYKPDEVTDFGDVPDKQAQQVMSGSW